MEIFDSHAHFDDAAFDEDRHQLLPRIHQESVRYITNIGCDERTNQSSVALAELEALSKAAQEPQEDPLPEPLPEIAFDDFCKVEMTVVKVLTCEKVKKSEKLLKFTLNDGTKEPRQILSGIAKYYEPEQLIGKTLVAVTNLAPRKMMGQLSCGMLLSAERGEKLQLVMLDDSVPAGARLV